MKSLTFNALMGALHQGLDELPNFRRGKNTQYTIKDAALGAFSVFYLQASSFLAHQRTLKRQKERSNAESLFGLEHISCDNQNRNLLNPIDAHRVFPLFDIVYQALEQADELADFRGWED